MNLVRLLAVELEGFRGFAERRALSLDADAVVIRGDNGNGKTSLIDALVWMLSGELAHLVERTRGLRKGDNDVVVSRFNPGGARVSLSIQTGGRQLVFTRTGTQAATELTVSDPSVSSRAETEQMFADVMGFSSIEALKLAALSWGILRQDRITAALDETGGALHERLSSIVGLEQVSAFAAACSQTARDLVRERTAARNAHRQIASRHADAAKLRDAAQIASPSSDRLETILRDGLATISSALEVRIAPQLTERPSLDELAKLGSQLRVVLVCAEGLASRQAEVRRVGDGTAIAVADAEAAITQAQSGVDEAATRAPHKAQLAASALELLGDRCPVCDQTIDQASLRSHLQEVYAEARDAMTAAQRAQDALAHARGALANARELESRRSKVEADMKAAQAALQDAIHDPTGAIVALNVETPANLLVERLETALADLRSLYRSGQEIEGAHVERLVAEVDALAAEVDEAAATLTRLDQQILQAKKLEDAAHEAARRIVERALAALQPSFAEVFDRLRPSPAFTELDVKQDIMNNRNQVVPVVRDTDRGIEANPLVVFSEGQLNVVALSYFLGMALNARNAALPFLVLDDPLQALDVMAILGFSDLCRRVRDQRQLIVTTHDRRFADVLVRKLSPREPDERLIVHDFETWTREGPSIKTSEPALAEIVPLLRQAS